MIIRSLGNARNQNTNKKTRHEKQQEQRRLQRVLNLILYDAHKDWLA